MRLSEEEFYEYINIHHKLMYYVGKKKNVLPKNISFEAFLDFTVQEKFKVREEIYENIDLLDDYIKEHSGILSEGEIKIIQDFKHFRKGTFYVMKLTEKHALFMDKDYVYAVLALSDPFHFFWGDDLPVMIQAVLLPFKGKIIYDGMFSSYPMRFGRGITASLKNDFNLAKGKYGIITQLPISDAIKEKAPDLEEILLMLMKTKSSREYNWHEIETLLEENPKLLPFYNQEWGKINSRKKKKELRNLGIKKQHFAMYVDLIIASGSSQAEVKKRVKDMISDKNVLDSIFYFKI